MRPEEDWKAQIVPLRRAMNEKVGKRKRRRLAAKARLAVNKQADVKPYFHGGNGGLEVGGYILPPSITGAPQNGDVPAHIRRNDRIYMVRNFTEAAPWAAHHPKPIVYEVEPDGSIEDDPDVDTPGISFQCQKAKIVAIHEIPLEMLLAAQRLLLQ
jgi:hypothetical protein